MSLDDDLERIAAAAAAHAGPGEALAGVIPTEPDPGARIYLCAFERDDGARTWLALDDGGDPVERRSLVRSAVSIAALCEVAEESAGGGDLDTLRSHLVSLRITENPPGLDEALAAVDELERTVGRPPRLASVDHLDAVGNAARELERAFGESAGSPFVEAMKQAPGAVDELARDVEAGYKLPLS